MSQDTSLVAIDSSSGRQTTYIRSRCAGEGCHKRLPGRRMQAEGDLPRYCSHLCGVNNQPNHVIVGRGGHTA